MYMNDHSPDGIMIERGDYVYTSFYGISQFVGISFWGPSDTANQVLDQKFYNRIYGFVPSEVWYQIMETTGTDSSFQIPAGTFEVLLNRGYDLGYEDSLEWSVPFSEITGVDPKFLVLIEGEPSSQLGVNHAKYIRAKSESAIITSCANAEFSVPTEIKYLNGADNSLAHYEQLYLYRPVRLRYNGVEEKSPMFIHGIVINNKLTYGNKELSLYENDNYIELAEPLSYYQNEAQYTHRFYVNSEMVESGWYGIIDQYGEIHNFEDDDLQLLYYDGTMLFVPETAYIKIDFNYDWAKFLPEFNNSLLNEIDGKQVVVSGFYYCFKVREYLKNEKPKWDWFIFRTYRYIYADLGNNVISYDADGSNKKDFNYEMLSTEHIYIELKEHYFAEISLLYESDSLKADKYLIPAEWLVFEKPDDDDDDSGGFGKKVTELPPTDSTQFERIDAQELLKEPITDEELEIDEEKEGLEIDEEKEGLEIDKEKEGLEIDKEKEGLEIDKEKEGLEIDEEKEGLEIDEEKEGLEIDEEELKKKEKARLKKLKKKKTKEELQKAKEIIGG